MLGKRRQKIMGKCVRRVIDRERRKEKRDRESERARESGIVTERKPVAKRPFVKPFLASFEFNALVFGASATTRK